MNGSTIYAIRQATGYSVTDLATVCHVSERSVRRWEHNVKSNQPSTQAMETIQAIYNEHIEAVEQGVKLALDSLDNFTEDKVANSAISFTFHVYEDQDRKLKKPFRAVNADTFAVADRLKSYGFNVTFTYNDVSDEFLPFADTYLLKVGLAQRKELIEGAYRTLTYKTIDEAYEAFNKIDPRAMFLTDLASKDTLEEMATFEYAVYLEGSCDDQPLDEIIDFKKYGLGDYIHESKN